MSKLFYVIGASGAGKDSVMNFAKTALNGSKSVFFAHRYITRPPDAKTENHISLTHNEFKARIKLGLFAMHWESHGNFYGVGKEINYWMYQGGAVVVNGSREYLPHALKTFKKLQPVLIETSPIILLQRLKERGRETDAEILERIERNNQLSVDRETLIVIRNDGQLKEAGTEFLEIITKVKNQIYF
jgi:ribose 1,5-bisphosphokinase